MRDQVRLFITVKGTGSVLPQLQDSVLDHLIHLNPPGFTESPDEVRGLIGVDLNPGVFEPRQVCWVVCTT